MNSTGYLHRAIIWRREPQIYLRGGEEQSRQLGTCSKVIMGAGLVATVLSVGLFVFARHTRKEG
jgi:hypothetical protein